MIKKSKSAPNYNYNFFRNVIKTYDSCHVKPSLTEKEVTEYAYEYMNSYYESIRKREVDFIMKSFCENYLKDKGVYCPVDINVMQNILKKFE